MSISEMCNDPEFQRLEKECGELHKQLMAKLEEVAEKFGNQPDHGGYYVFSMSAADTIIPHWISNNNKEEFDDVPW